MIRRMVQLAFAICVAMPQLTAQLPESGAPPEFYFTRLIYPSRGEFSEFGGFFGIDRRRGVRGRGCGEGGRGGGRWAVDCPEADYKFMWGVERLTNIRVHPDVHAVDILDPRLFEFPYLYIVEPGRMDLNGEQARTLREYLDRGGFLHIDDFWGLAELGNLVREMDKVFPDRPLQDLPLTHEIFHAFFDIDTIMQIPGIGNARRGGRTWEDRSDIDPRILGISDEQGRLQVIVTYNSDLGDAWEWMDDPGYPEIYSGQAYRMGVNFIIYAMTH